MASELHPWRFELEFFQVGYPVATSHFAVTPQSDIVRIGAHDFQCHGDAFGMSEMPVFVHLYPSDHNFAYIIVLRKL